MLPVNLTWHAVFLFVCLAPDQATKMQNGKNAPHTMTSTVLILLILPGLPNHGL
jgi:hypothetical protein